jgi:ABC-2 type transport system permease protein
MTLFLRIVRLSFQQQLTYRAAILAGLATNFFFALLRVAVLVALYDGRDAVNGLTLQGAISYVALSQAMIAFLFFFGTVEIMQSVYDGSIGSTLLKPFPLFLYWMASDLGRALVNLIGRGLLLLLVFSFFYPLIIPNRVEQWFFLPIALALGWLVSYAWRFLVNLAAFWTPDAVGFSRIAFTVSQLLSGFLMPLRIYPDWFADFCRMTPFAAMFNTTVEIYLGLLTGQQLLLALLSQLAWFILLVLLGQMVFTAGIRRLVIQGG